MAGKIKIMNITMKVNFIIVTIRFFTIEIQTRIFLMIGSLTVTVNGSNMNRARPAAAGISLKSAEAAPKEPESTRRSKRHSKTVDVDNKRDYH